MTFVIPTRASDPQKKLIAYDILHGSNLQLENLRKWRREQYEVFWYSRGVLRSWSEINDILVEIDAAEPGQSGKFFAHAVELVRLILTIDPGSLQTHEWYPKYEYTTSETGEVRMLEPVSEGE